MLVFLYGMYNSFQFCSVKDKSTTYIYIYMCITAWRRVRGRFLPALCDRVGRLHQGSYYGYPDAVTTLDRCVPCWNRQPDILSCYFYSFNSMEYLINFISWYIYFNLDYLSIFNVNICLFLVLSFAWKTNRRPIGLRFMYRYNILYNFPVLS